VFPEALSVGDEASRVLGEKHGDVFKGVLCEVGIVFAASHRWTVRLPTRRISAGASWMRLTTRAPEKHAV